MKVVISGDEYCYLKNGKHYLDDAGIILISRYLKAFDEVFFAIRTKTITEKEELDKYHNLVDDNRIKIIQIPFFQGPQEYLLLYNKVRVTALEALKGCDLAIFRLPSTTAFALWHTAIKLKIPYVTEIVFDCYDGYETTNNLLYKILWKILHQWQVKACNNAIGVACVTEHYLQQRYFPLNKDAVISNYSTIELNPSFYYKSRVYPQKKCFTIVHVANQVAYASRKGHNELIKVGYEVNKLGYNVEVKFIGKDYFGGIERLRAFSRKLKIEDKICFTGFLSKSAMREVMINADIAILPTRAEGLPRVVIEAMALGLPCITSPVSGNPELVSKDLLIDYLDVRGMSLKVIDLIEHKQYYEKTSEDNFLRSRQYSSEVLNPRRTAFYNEVKSLIHNL